MSQHTYISILLLCLFNRFKAQTGAGCPVMTPCEEPGQIRYDAVYVQSRFVGGCNCACPMAVYDPSSPEYCAPPNQVNYDWSTFEGDCSCQQVTTAPPNNPGPGTPPQLPPRPVNPGTINGIPITAGAAVEILCEGPGNCECPPGTQGTCTINCEGKDACKDGVVECNNDGFDCSVFFGEFAGSSVTIEGPIGSPLTVTCFGDKSCEGSTAINAFDSTDLTVDCFGAEACKGNIRLNFGYGVGLLKCTGEPDACQGAMINLPHNADITPGAGFSCRGLFCPPDAPAAFLNMFGDHEVTCDTAGDCACPPGLQGTCTINCIGEVDACKDGIIECNNDGYDCIVNCMSYEGCGGAASIMGPAGSPLTVNCIGDKSCEGAFTVNGEMGTDLTAVCQGPEACKGNAIFNFGNGKGAVFCPGSSPDTCLGAAFNLHPESPTGPGIGFSCTGNACPADAPASFQNPGRIGRPNRPGPGFQTLPPRPRPTNNNPATLPPRPVNPVQTLPSGPAPPVATAPVTPVVTAPAGPTYPAGAEWCCQTSIANFVPWQGRCWGHTDRASCNAEANSRCAWDPTNCSPSAPACVVRGEVCVNNADCCSTVCASDSGNRLTCR